MASDNKITIQVDINNNSQEQIENYKSAFDDLRNSIDNLGKPPAGTSMWHRGTAIVTYALWHYKHFIFAISLSVFYIYQLY